MRENKSAAEAQVKDKVQEIKSSVIIKGFFKDFFKRHKKASAAMIILSVFIVLFIAAAAVFGNTDVQEKLYVSLIPETITDETTGVVFYRDGGPSLEEGANLENRLKVYYYPGNDTTKNKIYLDNGIYKDSSGSTCLPGMSFMLAPFATLNKIASAAQWAAVVLALAIVAILIYFWYRSFKKQELQRREEYRRSHPRARK